MHKKSNTLLYIFLLSLTIFSISCQNKVKYDIANYYADTRVNPNEHKYKAIANEFIQSAQKGNVKKMISLTSRKTLSIQGDAVKQRYIDQVIPVFQNTKVNWKSSRLVLDDEYNPGFEFHGSVEGEKSFPIYIVLFEEGEKIVVANIRRNKKL